MKRPLGESAAALSGLPMESRNPAPRFIAFGQVIGVHIDERFIKDGLLDTGAMKPIARAGYQEYFVTTSENRFCVEFVKPGRAAPRDTDE